MKKLTAMLLSVMLIACSMTACEDADEESGSGKASSSGTSASTEADDEEGSTEDVTTAKTTTEKPTETTAEKTTEEETTEASTEEETEEKTEDKTEDKTEEKSSDAASNSITGRWKDVYNLTEKIITFEPDGTFSDVMDYTPYLCIKDGKATYVGIEVEAVLEGETLSIIYEGRTMKRYGLMYPLGEDGSIEGLYTEIPEEDSIWSSGNDCEYYRIVNGKTELIIDGKYTVSGDTLKTVSYTPTGIEIATEFTYAFDGDKLVITKTENGTEIICERAD